MFLIKMVKQQQSSFTHPKEFAVLCDDEDEIEDTVRKHGFIGEYTIKDLPFLISPPKTYKNKLPSAAKVP
jgi:hypothetical protein